mmetsp:Transcript_22312/g.41488  ORF Transcript_22312/g.41488 Transcript_22312/m.41488 type:complete len:201 (-) Transcript_22312:1900-2502(-)
MIAFASQFILLLVACCGVCPALSSSAEARMTVAFTINDKKYEVPVSSAAKRDVVEAAAGFCRAHAAEVGIAGADQAQLQHCAEALVPTFEQVLEKQQRHPKQQQEASAEGAVTAEQPPDETITVRGALRAARECVFGNCHVSSRPSSTSGVQFTPSAFGPLKSLSPPRPTTSVCSTPQSSQCSPWTPRRLPAALNLCRLC